MLRRPVNREPVNREPRSDEKSWRICADEKMRDSVKHGPILAWRCDTKNNPVLPHYGCNSCRDALDEFCLYDKDGKHVLTGFLNGLSEEPHLSTLTDEEAKSTLNVLNILCNPSKNDTLVFVKSTDPDAGKFAHYTSYIKTSNPDAINHIIGGSGTVTRDRLKKWWLAFVDWLNKNSDKLSNVMMEIKTASEKKIGDDFLNYKKTLDFLEVMKKAIDRLDINLNEFDALLSILPKNLDLNNIDPVFISLHVLTKMKPSEITVPILLSKYGISKAVSAEEKKASGLPKLTITWKGDEGCATNVCWSCYPIDINNKELGCVNWWRSNFHNCLTHNNDSTCPRGGDATERMSLSPSVLFTKFGVFKIKIVVELYSETKTKIIPLRITFPPDNNGEVREETLDWVVDNSCIKTPIWTLYLDLKKYISDI